MIRKYATYMSAVAPPTIDDVFVVNTNTGTRDRTPMSSTAVHGDPSLRVRENVVFVATIRPIDTTTRKSLNTPIGRWEVMAFCAGVPPSIAALMSGIDG